MGDSIIYKYLDAKGGLRMLKGSNLQFTNATKFNDPFDCHPALFDYSNAPTNEHNWPPAEWISEMEENNMVNLRNETWITCFSKVYDSLLMWAYYNNHKGICLGLNKEAVLRSCHHGYFGLYYPFYREVEYKEIIHKPNFFRNRPFWESILTTKAKDWEHEQEIRLITKKPAWVNSRRDIPEDLKEDEIIDWTEIRHYPHIDSDCFESLYLGINIREKVKKEIIKAAKKLNPDIQIYKMDIDPNAFRLIAEQIR